nr:hypothetical protein [Rhodococcus sp. (in: high G+C Gram-positive bacteria)]
MTDKTDASTWWKWSTGITAALVATACGVILWSFSPPVVFFPIYALAQAVLLFLGAVWLVFAMIGWFRYRGLRWTAIAPALVILTAALVLFSVPSRTAFLVSKSSLETVAADCADSQQDRRIGAYSVLQIRRMDKGCLFFIQGGLIDSIGLAYLPDSDPRIGKPRHDGDFGFEEFSGDWYRFVQRF